MNNRATKILELFLATRDLLEYIHAEQPAVWEMVKEDVMLMSLEDRKNANSPELLN